MAILPFRGLAERGILRDPSPYQLDMNAWSAGINMRFHGNKAMRAPVWRTISDGLAFAPAHCVGYRPSTGFDLVFIVDDNGRVYKSLNGTITDLTAPGFVPAPDVRATTSTFLGDVTYINRPSGVPRYFGPTSTAFTAIPGWDPSWRCRVLRAFGDYLIALNVTKGSTTVKSMVKWSDLTLAGLPPGSWDANDPTKNTGENVLEDMTSPIVDGCSMRDVFVIYSGDQVWGMTQTGSQSIFKWSRLFSEGGVIAPNCVAEVDGKHYVFGTSDIYVHDGTTKQSIVDQRNRDYIFRNLNMKKTEVCHVQYMPRLNELVFAYQSGDSDCAFRGTDRCNKAAIYNIPGNTWSFIDLPNVASMTLANVNSVVTYAQAKARGLTYANSGGTYYDQDSGFDANVVAVSRALTPKPAANRVLAYDFLNKGNLAFPASSECNSAAFLERTGLDLDQVGSDLVTYKNIRRVYPQVTMFADVPVTIQVAGAMTPSGPYSWSKPIPFNPVNQYKVDIQEGGRYLGIRFTAVTMADFEINGFDVDVSPGGDR